jgi:hypothetical protein
MVIEAFLPGSIIYSAMLIVLVLFFTNILDTRKLLQVSDSMDKREIK